MTTRTEKSRNEKRDNFGFFYKALPQDSMTSIISDVYGLNEKSVTMFKLIMELNGLETTELAAGDVIYLPEPKKASEYADHIYAASMTLLEIRKQQKVAEILKKHKIK